MRMQRKHRFVVYKFNEDMSEIVVETASERNATWDDFRAAVPKDNGRYLGYDLEFTEPDGRKVSKILLLAYSPDSNTNNAEKFCIANQLGALKQ